MVLYSKRKGEAESRYSCRYEAWITVYVVLKFEKNTQNSALQRVLRIKKVLIMLIDLRKVYIC